MCADKIKINMRLNTRIFDEKNRLEITKTQKKDEKNQTQKFRFEFDAISGASTFRAVKNLREMQKIDSKTAFPDSLLSLLLFSTSDFRFLKEDSFFLNEQNGKIEIFFAHRKNAYKIITDEKGRANVWNDFFVSQIADGKDGVFSVKDEYVSPTGQILFDSIPFENEKADESISHVFSGILKFAFKKGILSVSGTLEKVPFQKPPKEEEKSDSPERNEPASEVEAESKEIVQR